MDDFDPAEPAGNNNEDDMTSTNDAELMKLAWRDEKAAPEILAYKDDLLARVMEQVAFQVGLLPEFLGDSFEVVWHRFVLLSYLYHKDCVSISMPLQACPSPALILRICFVYAFAEVRSL